MFFQRASLEYF